MNGGRSESIPIELIDFHTHILPKMDDGSSSSDESAAMLEACVKQGIKRVVLTPHFYANRDNPAHFLEKRRASFARLREIMQDKACPELIPAAEVEYFEGITAMQELVDMRIGDSRGLLIEMPFTPWSPRVVHDIIEINNQREFRVILAHIERYMKFVKDETLIQLIEAGVRMQSNASFFTENLFGGSKAIKAFDRGLIHLLGSDCHNTDTRKPNLNTACDLIVKKRGPEALAHIMARGAHILADKAN